MRVANVRIGNGECTNGRTRLIFTNGQRGQRHISRRLGDLGRLRRLAAGRNIDVDCSGEYFLEHTASVFVDSPNPQQRTTRLIAYGVGRPFDATELAALERENVQEV